MHIELTERFIKQYSRLPEAIKRKVDKAFTLLDADFRHPGLRIHPVESAPGVIEAYIDRKYRMTFEHHGDTLVMRNIDNHDDYLRQP
jgi:hypothetical protein